MTDREQKKLNDRAEVFKTERDEFWDRCTKLQAQLEAAQKQVTDLTLRNAELALELLAAEKHAEMLTAALEMSGVDADEILDAMEEVSHDRL